MKNLDTLIQDIYSSLEGLSSGEALNISEEELDLTLSRIKESIIAWSKPREVESSFRLRMSNIGRPLRQLWYESKNTSDPHTVSGSTQIKFLYGHILEEIVLMLVRMAGHEVTSEQKEVNVSGITGHMDCKIDGQVVDVKTASKFSFNKFKDGSLVNNDPFGYLAQLSGYETAEQTKEGGFLVINKESGELCLFRPDDLEKPNVKEKIKKVKAAIAVDTPPDRCYTLIPEGKKGNMKLPSGCAYCPYKFECYSDANDGDGLRAFRYSNGPVYFTEVVVEPRVEEILL
tara:strand:+ start:236 stop:1096 length:861 start_codon:yes stop_codon:yes gene_type:complete